MSGLHIIFESIWKNGAKIEVGVYRKPVEGEDKSDIIHLFIKPAKSKARGWIMNIQDANDIIYGLSKAISYAIDNDAPFMPKSN